jgi:hypothetical protein
VSTNADARVRALVGGDAMMAERALSIDRDRGLGFQFVRGEVSSRWGDETLE